MIVSFDELVKAHWLADTDIDEFFCLSIKEVEKAMLVYCELDYLSSKMPIDPHGLDITQFIEASNKLDRRNNNHA